MPSLASDLKLLRQQVEKLQVEVAGRKSIGSIVVWDEQNQSSVNQETSRRQEDFNGLVIHLTHELSPLEGTVKGLNQNEFEALKEQIRESLAASTPRTDAGTAGTADQ